MKKTSLIILCIFCFFAATGKTITKLSGVITNRLSDSVLIRFVQTDNLLSPLQYRAALNKNGEFSLAFPLQDEFTRIVFQHGNQQTELYMEPGSDLTMQLNAADFDKSIRYDGTGGELANFSAKYIFETGDIYSFDVKYQRFLLKEPFEFEDSVKQLAQKEKDFLKINGKELPVAFVDYRLADVDYKMYLSMLKYTFMHEAQKMKSFSFILRKDDFTAVGDVPVVFNDKYLCLRSYQGYLQNIFSVKQEYKNSIAGKDIFSPSPDSMAETEAYEKMPPASSEFFHAQALSQSLKNNSMAENEPKLAAFAAHFPDSKYIGNFEEMVSLKRRLSVGKPAADFDIVTPEGRKMKLSELKGKVVYIDFWASWCGACKAEMPRSAEVKDHFKDQPVAFVYVSIDDNMDAWKKAMETTGVSGINTLSTGGWKSPVALMYGVQSVPAHFLIDENGNFATDQTPAPGQKEQLITAIQKLLK